MFLQQDDVLFLLLKTKSLDESEVIWCAYQDCFNLCDKKPMEYNPTIFPSFTNFFEYLLDKEEKMQAEDAELNKTTDLQVTLQISSFYY